MKISPKKRNQLIFTIIGIVIVLGLAWFGLVGWQQGRLKAINDQTTTALDNEKKMQQATKFADKVKAELDTVQQQLNRSEADMGSGDLYVWAVTMVKDFKVAYPHIDIPQLSTPEVSDCNLISKFPYRQATISINGTAFFHDLGKFIADFENRYPHARVQNLDLSPASGAERDNEHEKLAFHMEIVALVNLPPALTERK
jgi:Tfp pilus assembly protein PilO